MDIVYYETNILSLESRFNSLINLAQAIESANGMSKKIALEAMDIIPNFNNNLPIAFYSNDPSFAQQRVSLESFVSSILKTISSICGFMSEMVKKVTTWLFPSNSGSTKQLMGDLDFIEQLTNNDLDFTHLNKVVKDAQQNASSKNDDLDFTQMGKVAYEDAHAGNRIRNVDEIIADYVDAAGKDSELAKVLDESDPLFHDVLNKGKYYTAVKDVKDGVRYIKDYLMQTNKAVHNLNTATAAQKKTAGSNVPELEEIAPFQINDKNITFADAAKQIDDAKNEVVSASNSQGKIPFSKLSETFTSSVKLLQISATLKFVDDSENSLTDLQKTIDSFQKTIDEIGNSEQELVEFAKRIGKTVSLIRSDLMGCLKFIKEISQYASLLKKMHDKLRSVQKQALKVIESDIKVICGTVPDEFKNVYDKLSDQLSVKS